MLLTRQELIDLTGAKGPKAAARWLDRERIRYAIGLDGWPRVLRSVILAHLGEVPPPNESRSRAQACGPRGVDSSRPRRHTRRRRGA